MKLIRYDYPALPSFRDFDRLFTEFWGGTPRMGALTSLGASEIPADLYEDDANLYARFELPGFKKSELAIDLENSVLTLSAERKAEKEDEEELSLSRSLTLPDGIDAEKVSAKYEDGLLTVALPKTPERKPKAIEIA
jgi:HSP20 family protein